MKTELENALHEVSLWQQGFLSPQRDAFNDLFKQPYIDGTAIDRLSISDVAIKFGWSWCADTLEFDVQ